MTKNLSVLVAGVLSGVRLAVCGRMAVGILVLAGCGTGLPGYSKTGASDRQVALDYYDCRRDSTVLIEHGKGMQQYVVDSAKLKSCMSARGYDVPSQ